MRCDDEDGEEAEWGHNEDVARLERYSEGARDQALLVKARVDDEVEVVLVFKVPNTSQQSSNPTSACNAHLYEKKTRSCTRTVHCRASAPRI